MTAKTQPDQMQVEEYKEIGLNLRHYSNMVYVNLTLFLTSNAAILSVIFGRDKDSGPLGTAARVIFEAAGILLTIVFFVNEYRLRLYWHTYFSRAIAIEGQYDLSQYSAAPPRSRISSALAMRATYALVAAFWALTLVIPWVFQ